ncbi:MAG: hypothetical protein AB1798_21695 [Spirochaetota bacterium]
MSPGYIPQDGPESCLGHWLQRFAIPLAAGVLFPLGILLSPAMGAVLMSLSTVIVAINARFLRVMKRPR